jgi:uncharacterized surface anchored protein
MKLKKTLAIIIAAVMLVGAIPFMAFAADWGEGDTLDDALSELKVGFDDAYLDWLVLPGLGVIKLRYTYFMFKNTRTGTIDEHPVYCIDPTKGGAHEIVAAVGSNPDDGSNTATYIRGEKVGDPKYRGILNEGYPHNLWSSLTKEEAYYATKLALWMYIRGNDPTKLTINPAYASGDTAANRVRDAAVSIFNKGVAGSTYEPELTLMGKPSNTAKLDANGEYYTQEIEVYANGWIGTNSAASGDVLLSWDSAPPAGTVVLGSNGEDIASSMSVTMAAQSGRNGRYGKVMVKYPAEAIEPETFSPPTLKASALMSNSEIYAAYAKANKDKYQRYLVERDPKIELAASFVSQLAWEPGDVDYPDSSHLRIRKVQEGTNIPLEGAVFEIRDPDGKLIYSLATDEDGIIDAPLSVMGNYTVTETVPPRYHLLPRVRTQNVTARYGETAEVTFADTPYGFLRVVKRDASNGRPLGGAAIRIKNIATNTTQEGFTDSSGSAVFDKLPIGGYEIAEITAPDGYALDGAVHTTNVVPLSEGETSYVLTNKAKAGLRIIKFDRQAMTPIEGVVFEIWKGGELYGMYRTDALGEIELRNLPAGTYTAREIATVAPYVLDETAQWTEIRGGQGYISELYFFNLQKPGMRLVKVDSETLAPLSNARFLISSIGGTFSIEYTTDINGEINLSALEPGAYLVKELAAPDGYLVDGGERVVQLNAGENAQFVFADTRKPSLELIKLDSKTGLPLAGATFRIAEIKDGSRYLDRVTDTQGKIRIDGLMPGVYSIAEIAAPEGYVADTTEYHTELFPGKTSTLVVNNAHKPNLKIVKRDAVTGGLLAGASFKIRKTDSTAYSTVTTDANGEAWLYDLAPGVYEAAETLPPPNYLPNGTPLLVALLPNRTGVVEFYNFKKPTLTLIKYDELTNKPLAGASFRLWRTEGETWSETQITDANGRITWEGLDSGIYSVQEIDEPYGYAKDPNRKEIRLKGGDNKFLEFFNRPRPVLTILKRDKITGEPLPGVKFLIQKVEGETIGEFLTDANGRIELSPAKGYLLTEEIYRVTELTPPNEYLLDAVNVKEVKLKWHEPTELIFENLLKPTLIFIKRDGMSGRGISGAMYKIEYESPMGGVANIGSYVTKCGLIVVPYVLPGWYSLTETRSASGYQLPTNPTQRLHLAPGENSYTYAQTHEDLYVDARTNPNNGQRGMCGDWCGFLFSVLCAGNCGNAGGGTGGAFGNMVITNGNGETLGNTGGGTAPTDTAAPILTAGTVNRTGNFSATIQFTSSEAGRYYTVYTSSGGNVPTISTLGTGTVCSAGLNTIAVSLTTGAKDLYIKVKDAAGNVGDALKIVIPAYNANTQIPMPPSDTPDFGGIVITGGTVVWLNPDFSGITITFGN